MRPESCTECKDAQEKRPKQCALWIIGVEGFDASLVAVHGELSEPRCRSGRHEDPRPGSGENPTRHLPTEGRPKCSCGVGCCPRGKVHLVCTGRFPSAGPLRLSETVRMTAISSLRDLIPRSDTAIGYCVPGNAPFMVLESPSARRRNGHSRNELPVQGRSRQVGEKALLRSPGRRFGQRGAYSTSMSIDPQRGLILIWMVQHAGYPKPDGPRVLPAFTETALGLFGHQ